LSQVAAKQVWRRYLPAGTTATFFKAPPMSPNNGGYLSG
jgi:hypothetical protein